MRPTGPNSRPLVLSLLLALGLAGCAGSTRVVIPTHQNDAGGVVILEGKRDDAVKDATPTMMEHCGEDQFEVVAEEQVEVASTAPTVSHDTVHGALIQQVPPHQEHRVRYICTLKRTSRES